MHKLKIIIAIEYPLVVKVLKDIAINKGLEIAAVCDNNKEAYQQIIKHKPDIAILGICSVRMNAIKVIEKLAAENIKLNIIVKSGFTGKGLYNRCMEFDIKGYLLKSNLTEEIENCIETVVNGNIYHNKKLKAKLTDDNTEGSYGYLCLLTITELKILQLIADNKSTQQITETLFISEKTVKTHRDNITKKLKIAPSQNNLSNWAKEHQIMLGDVD